MPVPARFFLGLVSGALLAWALFVGAVLGQVGAPSTGSAWAAAINARKLAAARAITARKLLVVGGSGALFGVKARQLEVTLHLPAINLASHAALGTSYLLDLARRVATPGDTVLLIPEYELYDYGDATRRTWADAVYLDYLMAAEPARFRQLPPLDLLLLSFRVPTSRLAEGWRHRFASPPPTIYRTYHPYDPALVDDHGDMTGHRAERLPEKSRGPLGTSDTLIHGLAPQPSGMADLRAFCTWAEQQQIRVVAALPVLSENEAYTRLPASRALIEIQAFWHARGIPLLSRFEDTLLPRSQFFDTCYHLTEEAAATRTAQLARELAPHLAAPTGAARLPDRTDGLDRPQAARPEPVSISHDP
jgi:hypothetical protein